MIRCDITLSSLFLYPLLVAAVGIGYSIFYHLFNNRLPIQVLIKAEKKEFGLFIGTLRSSIIRIPLNFNRTEQAFL